jgi:hypothetical protein
MEPTPSFVETGSSAHAQVDEWMAEIYSNGTYPPCGPQPDLPISFHHSIHLPWVDVKYQHEVGWSQRFETTFQKSAEGVLASKEVELMPLEEMMYYGPSVGKGKEKVENDVVSWQEKDRIEGRLVSANGESTPSVPTIRWLFNTIFFWEKSVLPGEPVTRRLVSMGGQHRRMTLPWPWHHDSEFLSPPARAGRSRRTASST